MKNNDIKISIIIPIYNVEKYLFDCLHSIKSQILSEFEVICIDDCSTDSSYEILSSFSKKDKRFLAYKNSKNIGQGATRNKGIELATGQYIGFIDSDDYIDCNYYKLLYEKAQISNADIVGTHTIACRLNGEKEEATWMDKFDYEKDTYTDSDEKIFLVYRNCNTSPCSHIYKKQLLENNISLRFANDLNGEDQYFNVLAFFLSKKISFLTTKIAPYYYRCDVGTNAVPKKNDPKYRKKLFDQLEISKIIMDYAIDNHFTKKSIRQLLSDSIRVNIQRHDSLPKEWQQDYYRNLLTLIGSYVPIENLEDLFNLEKKKEVQEIKGAQEIRKPFPRLFINILTMFIPFKKTRKNIRKKFK